MLRVLNRRIVAHAALFRNSTVRRSDFGTIPAARGTAVVQVLQRLESTISANSKANADDILKNLHALHSLQTIIPLSYFLDAANILSARNDATRLELLIHICKENLKNVGGQVDKKTFQSRPRDDSLDRLVSYSISGLFSSGNKDDASKLWVRMSNSGFVTHRVSIERMIEQVSSSHDYSPSLQLLHSLHSAMKAHLWHQNPHYFAKTLNMIRRYILTEGTESDALQKGIATLEGMWGDAQKVLVTSSVTHLPVELYALRLHCYAAAMQVSQRGDSSPECVARYGDIAAAAFKELVEQSSAADDRNAATAKISVLDIATEVAQILSGFRGKLSNQSEDENIQTPTLTGALPAAGHSSLYTKVGDTRRSSRLFLKQVANQGQPLQAMNLFRHYIKSHPSTKANNQNDVWVSPAQQRGFVDTPEAFRNVVADDSSVADEDRSRAAVIAALANRSLFRNNVVFNGANSLNPPRATTSKYTAEERIWQGDTVCELLRSANVARSLISLHDSKNGVSFEFRVFKELETVFLAAKDILLQYQLKPGSKFYSSFIDALSYNMQYLSDHPARSSDIAIPWQSSLAVARTLLDGVDPRIADSAEVYHSLIRLLCQGSRNPEPDPKAVLRALQLINDKGDDKHLIFPATVATLLEAATTSLDESLLSRVLIELEHLLRASSRAGTLSPTSPSDTEGTVMVLSARIYAHCRLREGYRALGLLRVLRPLGIKLPRSLYLSIISSLYHSKPGSQWAKDVDADPTSTIEFLVEEMKRDKYDIDSQLVARFMRLYTKAAQNAEDADRVLANMNKFVKRCRSRKGVLGVKVVAVDAQIVRELVKAHCLAGKFVQAKDIAEQCESVYGVKLTAEVFEPIIFKLSAHDGQIAEAESVILQLLNKGLLVTSSVVGSIVIGHLRYGDRRDALDCVQDMHNLHGVCPTPAVWMMLLDASLSAGDVAEARRAVSFLRQLHSAEERELLVGQRIEEFSHSGGDDLAHTTATSANKMETEDIERQEAVFSYWNPLSYFNLGTTTKKAARVESVEDQLPRKIRIRQDVPVGHQERGVLSDSSLEKIFQRFGQSLK